MSLPSLFSAFSGFLHSPQFLSLACHADAGNAFVRKRKLPLPALVAVMLSGMCKSGQTELDEFFAHLKEQAQLGRHVSEPAFTKARAKLSTTAIPALNDWLVERADVDGLLPRWHGRRLVAADASTLRLGRRASHVARAASTVLPVLLRRARIGTQVSKMLRTLLNLIAGRTYLHRENRSRPQTPGRRPHKNMTQKNC